MRLRKFTKSNEGVVGIVVAVLLIGLLVSVVSLLQYMYVPKWMEETEAKHMDDVLIQFSELKFAIDIQIANNITNSPIATSITLGSEKLPFLMSMKAYGSLGIYSNSCNITIDYNSGASTLLVNLGTIRYTSANAYYIPEEKQSYIYEAGSIITNQTSGESISIGPSFKPAIDPDKKIIFRLVNIIGIRDKVTFGGYDTVPIQTEFFNSTIFPPIPDIKFMNITTSYPQAWIVFLNSSLKAGGYLHSNFTHLNDYFLDYDEIDDHVRIKFFANPDFPDMELYLNEIKAQIGPGWIE